MIRTLPMVAILVATEILSAQATAPARPLAIDDIVGRERADAFDLAPDGGRAVFVRHRPDAKKNRMRGTIWIVDLATGASRRLTAGKAAERAPKWSPDGRHVAFLSARPSDAEESEEKAAARLGREEEEEGPKTQVFLLPMSGGEAVAVTSFPEGVAGYSWAGSSKLVVLARERLAADERRAKKEKDGTDAVEDLGHWRLGAVRLFLVEVGESGAGKTSRLTENEDQIESVVASPDGELVVAVHQRTPLFGVDAKVPPRIVVWSTKTGTGREIFSDRKSRPRAFFWSADNRTLYATGNRPTVDGEDMAGITVAYAIDRESLAPETIDLDWPAGLTDGSLAPRDDGILARLAAGVRPKAALLRGTGARLQRVVLEGDAAARVHALAARPGVARVLYRAATASDPGGWYAGRIEGARLVEERKLDVVDEPYAGKALAKTEVLRFTGAGGDQVEGILFRPLRHREGELHPLILMTHGGPHAADYDDVADDWAYAPNLYAARGAYVLAVNYHGSSDYGLAFSESIRGRYLELELIDLCKGIEHVLGREPVDGGRLGLVGWSNGAILSIAMVTLAKDLAPGFDWRFRVCAAGAGDVNWVSDYGPCEFGVAFDDYYLGAPPWKVPEVYARKSAIYRAESVTTPTIIFFGSEDRAVPTGQGWEWYRALQQVGKTEVRYFLFPGEAHTLAKLSHQRRKLTEELRFVERHLFGTEPRSAVEEGSPAWAASARHAPAREGGAFGVAHPPASETRTAAPALVPEIVDAGDVRIGRFEVTRAQWKAFATDFEAGDGCADLPVSGVSFEQASAYVAWLRATTGRRFRLPTRKELEKLGGAAGEENTLDWWLGARPSALEVKDFRRDLDALGVGRPCAPAPSLVLRVGSRPPAAVGPRGSKVAVYDLAGNVAEWASPDDGEAAGSRPATRPAQPRPVGGCAWLPSDPSASDATPPPEYVGLRVAEDP